MSDARHREPACDLFALATVLSIAPPAVAQTLPRIARIGPSSAAVHAPCVAAFKDGMRELGLLEGRQYILEGRYAEAHYERFPALTEELL